MGKSNLLLKVTDILTPFASALHSCKWNASKLIWFAIRMQCFYLLLLFIYLHGPNKFNDMVIFDLRKCHLIWSTLIQFERVICLNSSICLLLLFTIHLFHFYFIFLIVCLFSSSILCVWFFVVAKIGRPKASFQNSLLLEYIQWWQSIPFN